MAEKYYQAISERSYLQITTSKEGLIISLMNRSLSDNGKWSTITLNAEQYDGLKKFFKEVACQI